MSSKKEMIEALKNEKRLLEDQIAGMRREIMFKDENIKKQHISLNEAREEFKEKYAKLLERYIAMMERTARIDEQSENTVEVIRCKDCEHFYQDGNIKLCRHWNCHSTEDDAYCSYAKMKGGEEEWE